jgi:hypothetical protein
MFQVGRLIAAVNIKAGPGHPAGFFVWLMLLNIAVSGLAPIIHDPLHSSFS